MPVARKASLGWLDNVLRVIRTSAGILNACRDAATQIQAEQSLSDEELNAKTEGVLLYEEIANLVPSE